MSFTSFYSFIHMGGYAPYVWSAYAITASVLLANIMIPLRQRRKLRGDGET